MSLIPLLSTSFVIMFNFHLRSIRYSQKQARLELALEWGWSVCKVIWSISTVLSAWWGSQAWRWCDQVMGYTELEQTKVQSNCLLGMWDGASVLLLGSMAVKFWSFLFAETLVSDSEANDVLFYFLPFSVSFLPYFSTTLPSTYFMYFKEK
jgi:hypothetical protein